MNDILRPVPRLVSINRQQLVRRRPAESGRFAVATSSDQSRWHDLDVSIPERPRAGAYGQPGEQRAAAGCGAGGRRHRAEATGRLGGAGGGRACAERERCAAPAAAGWFDLKVADYVTGPAPSPGAPPPTQTLILATGRVPLVIADPQQSGSNSGRHCLWAATD
jgi:hypothetical protein